MASLADAIERHIKQLFEQSMADVIEIRRVDLAGHFSCVPSQINYVLQTRFTPQRGYAVESRRGGGGFIRIIRLREAQTDRAGTVHSLAERIGPSIGAREADALIESLEQAGLIAPREALVWRVAIHHQTAGLPAGLRDRVRAALLRSVMMVRFLDLFEPQGMM
ncbi:MAG: CtsR family transcriptional regulator [Limnochordaceae bacterium]|uniref:CtsR family transcriptional regulator n=1 Tax=Carboxydichorda subterranea TaxID=3109565 RepID=A0ABZ1BXZ7_9FIRM|nr:CtsR family transcriptional regulator [Limnochorda sp. L945t]MBE3599072.1 CtsR family transcriptional regulator [Limnochordaceae bacterium]WRP17681.1 CtsR family transcriptional regulator [Limnochorda sp. L945t]